MSEVRIAAEPRTEFGKGASRRARRAGKVPAVLYGHGIETRHLSLPGHDLMLALKTPNVLIRLEGLDKDNLVLPKSVQRDAIKGFLEHIDLLVVSKGEKVDVEVPLILVGEIKPPGVLNQELVTVRVKAEATQIPTHVDFDIQGMEIGAVPVASEIVLPEGAVLMDDPETTVLTVSAPRVEEEPETSTEATEGAVAE